MPEGYDPYTGLPLDAPIMDWGLNTPLGFGGPSYAPYPETPGPTPGPPPMPTQTPVPVAPPTYTADPSIPFRDRIPHRPNSGDIIDRRTPPAYSFGPGDQASLVGGWPEPTPAPFDYGPAPAGFPSWDEWSTAWNGYWNGPTDQSTGARWLPQWMVNEFSLPTTDGAWVRDIDRNHGLAEYWDGSSWSPFRYDV